MTGLDEIVVRDVTASELRLVRSSWVKAWEPRRHELVPMSTGQKGHQWSRKRFVSAEMARRMVRLAVSEMATLDNVKVVAIGLGGGRDEALGWVARSLQPEPDRIVLHMLYVIHAARNEGLGTILLNFVRGEAKALGIDLVPDCMTPGGLRLWEKEHGELRAS